MSGGGRRLVAIAVLAAVVVAGSVGFSSAQQVPLPASSIPKFVEPLPVFTPDIRVDGTRPLERDGVGRAPLLISAHSEPSRGGYSPGL